DIASFMRVTIYPTDLAALILGVDVIGIRRIGKHPKAIAIVHIFPLRISDAAWILRLANKGTVVLQTAIDAIGVLIIEAYVIELRHRQVFALPPFRAAVVGIPHPTIVAGEHDLRIGWVDPDAVHVAVHPAESAHHRETFSSVLADNQRAVGLEHAVWIFGIHDQIREVERTPYHPLALVTLFPCHPAIIGNEQRAIRRFDKSINALRVRRRDRYGDAAIRFLWETFIGLKRDFRPSIATVAGTKQSAGRGRARTVAARAVLPAFAPEIPHSGKHNLGIGRVDCYVRATGRKIRSLENL